MLWLTNCLFLCNFWYFWVLFCIFVFVFFRTIGYYFVLLGTWTYLWYGMVWHGLVWFGMEWDYWYMTKEMWITKCDSLNVTNSQMWLRKLNIWLSTTVQFKLVLSLAQLQSQLVLQIFTHKIIHNIKWNRIKCLCVSALSLYLCGLCLPVRLEVTQLSIICSKRTLSLLKLNIVIWKFSTDVKLIKVFRLSGHTCFHRFTQFYTEHF